MVDAMRPGDGATPAASGETALFDPGTQLGRDYTAVEWAAGPLGPIDTWPGSLKNTVRLMISSRFSMWMAWGPQLVFFCNDAYRRDTLGAKYPWALGRPATDVWSEIWPDIGPRIDSVMSTGVATWDEGLLLFLERSGYVEETYHTFSYSPLTDDDGRIAGMLCVVSEDTGRVISERRITALSDLGSDLAKAATEDEVFAAARRQLAADPYDIPFAACYLLDPEARAARLAWTAGITAGHRAAPDSFELGDPTSPWAVANPGDGRTHVVDDLASRFGELPTGAWSDPPVQALIVPLAQPGEGDPYGFLIIGTNRHRTLDAEYLSFVDLVAGQISAAITRARAFAAERRRVEQMAELDRAKTTFFTNVSHELRTPLTLLLGPAEDLLADVALPGPQRDQIEVIHRNGERLLKLVNTLLDFSRLESRSVQARFEPLDLARYTGELANMFESALARAGLTLRVDCALLAEPIYVDREMWAKIVLNLMSNALKATFEGGITVRLAPGEHGGAHLSVTDTGVGIPAAEQDRLFERFHRVSGAALRTHEGSGIGLALVAELAGLHGGRVAVQSSLDHGSTFTVELPPGTEHLPPDRVFEAAVEDVHGAAEYGAGYLAEAMRWVDPDTGDGSVVVPESGRHRILVVDDNADMRNYISRLLGEEFAVRTAPDGVVALDLARADPPDLVLTDVMMPNLDGFGLLTALRADTATMHVPVVMLSARSGDDAAVEGLEAGADDYLVKPFAARELLARVRANLELDRVRRLVDELQRQGAMLATAEELADVGSYEVDTVADVITGSAQFYRMVGASPADFATGGLAAGLRRVHPDDYERVAAAVERSLQTGESLGTEYRLVVPPDVERVVWVTGVVECGPDGTAIALRGSIQDITDRRRAEQSAAAAAAAREAEAREHAIAQELQRSLLPARTFDADHLDVATFYQAGVAGTEVGGDWYDVIELDAGRTALVLGDVMGRGVRAAAVMGQLRATVRAYSRLDLSPDYLLHLLDAAVREISNETIVTCVYAIYDPSERTLTYANAGHLPPLLTLPGGTVQRLVAGGPPLGTGRTWAKPETLNLPPGAMLTFYTDGLVERRGTDLDEGIDRLVRHLGTIAGPLEALPGLLVDELLADRHDGADGPDDDVAVLIARVSDRSSAERFASLDLVADADAPRLAREFATRQLAEWVVPEEVGYDVELIVSELVTNALRHGAPPIEMRMRRALDRIFVDVHDSASAPPQMRHAGPADDNGRGLLIVATLAERWGTRLTETGKSVWCLVRLP